MWLFGGGCGVLVEVVVGYLYIDLYLFGFYFYGFGEVYCVDVGYL